MNLSLFDLYKIGIGPSSSHTVGPMKAARQFVLDLDDEIENVASVEVDLYGSLAMTGEGHGSVMAVMVGLEGHPPDEVLHSEVRALTSRCEKDHVLLVGGEKKIYFRPEIHIRLQKGKRLSYHTNGMRFRASDAVGNTLLKKTYYSIGGGFVIDHDVIKKTSNKTRRTFPFSFSTAQELLDLGRKNHMSIAEMIWENEKQLRSEEEISLGIKNLWHVMQDSVFRGCHQEGVLPGRLKVKRRAPKLYQKLASEAEMETYDDPAIIMDWVSLFAMAVNEENASFGRIVTAPTNGAAGIIPAVLHYYEKFIPSFEVKGIETFFLTSSAIGALYKMKASISGAEVGCQGEVGVASSMAAAGLAAALGGTNEQVENAAEIAMEHHLGMTCDPIAGLVQIPCIERNTMGAIKAINATRLALRQDGDHYVTLDEVIKTMYQVGKDMDEKYKETSTGGLAKYVAVKDDPYYVSVNITEC